MENNTLSFIQTTVTGNTYVPGTSTTVTVTGSYPTAHKFCPNCGKKFKSGWQFCPIDGTSRTYYTPYYWPQWSYGTFTVSNPPSTICTSGGITGGIISISNDGVTSISNGQSIPGSTT